MISILIKTFERHEALLKCVKSIRKFYPKVNIIIADDSREPRPIAGTDYICLPHDTGLSAGRNTMVDNCQTEYCFIIEDDMTFSDKTDLNKLLKVSKDYDIAIPKVIRGEFEDDYSGKIVLEGDVVKFVREKEDKGDHYKVDIGLNCLFGKTEYFRKHRWDNDLKVGEHQEYFIRNRPIVAQMKDVSIDHNPVSNDYYLEYRQRAKIYQSLAKKKMGISKIIGFDNNEIND
jgi:(N-acetylneuraminyl)-galactosylglucosylceramide N-acetylgalactosaminyltransferase